MQVGSGNVGVGAGGVGGWPPRCAAAAGNRRKHFNYHLHLEMLCARSRVRDAAQDHFLRVAAICKLGVATYDGLKYVEGGPLP